MLVVFVVLYSVGPQQARWNRKEKNAIQPKEKETNRAALSDAIIRYGPLVTIAVRPLSVLIS